MAADGTVCPFSCLGFGVDLFYMCSRLRERANEAHEIG